MKRILQRIWSWDWSEIIALLALGAIGVSLCVYMRPLLPVHADGKLQSGDALISNGDTFWITNYATTNLTNYWLETEKQIKQWHNSNYTTVEWVGKIVTADDSDKYTPRGIGWLKDYELGLRSDGVVVWREAK